MDSQSSGDIAFDGAPLTPEARDGSWLAALARSQERDIQEVQQGGLRIVEGGAYEGFPNDAQEVTAPQVLQMLQEIWVREHPHRELPMMCLDTVRRMLDRWGWSWRRAHKRRRPNVDPDSAVLFVFHILYLLADGVEPADIVDADEAAFLLYAQGFYTWARRGREAVQIHVA
jgi:hypothetical protein